MRSAGSAPAERREGAVPAGRPDRQAITCDTCGRDLTVEESVVGFGGVACPTCEEWVTGACFECGGDLSGQVTDVPCHCARDERAVGSALIALGLRAEVEELGGGLIGVHVLLRTDRYALITRHEGPWIIGPYTADDLDEDLLRGHEAPCPGVRAAEVTAWALPTLAEWAVS